jgi:hypothetical protein
MYSKLFSSIVHSSLWTEPDHVRILFITLLAIADREGFIFGSRNGLLRLANVDPEQCAEKDPFKTLMEPDPDSSDLTRNPENEGRRIEPIDGGFRILNFEHYRAQRNEADRREQNRQAQARWRAKHKQNVSDSNTQPGSASETQPGSASVSQHQPISDADADADAEREREERARAESKQSNQDLIQHAEAKKLFAELSVEIFGRSLRENQWTAELNYWLDQAMPMKREDWALIDWFYRLPHDHEAFTMTYRRQSLGALLENLVNEIDKIRTIRKKMGMNGAPGSAQNQSEPEGWTKKRRVAFELMFPEAKVLDVDPGPFHLLGAELCAKIDNEASKL